jgi:hypothetical protein
MHGQILEVIEKKTGMTYFCHTDIQISDVDDRQTNTNIILEVLHQETRK